MRNDISLFIDKMDDMLSTDLKQYIIVKINKEANLEKIKLQKEIKNKMHDELKKVFNTVYNFGGIRLYRNSNDQFVVENSLVNRSIFMYSRRNNNHDLSNDNETDSNMNNLVSLQNNSPSQNEIVLFNSVQNPQHRIKIYVLYI
jgi:hypothetical protein